MSDYSDLVCLAHNHASREGEAICSARHQIAKLREQLQAMTLERDTALADTMGVVNVLGFFASCIKSGEQWTPQCDDMLHAAFAHRNRK